MYKLPEIGIGKIILFVVLFLVIALGTVIILNWDKFARIQEVELREVDCSKKAELLEEVYLNDQRIRKEDFPFLEFVKEDHKNLEIVISILDKCGMPTLQEVSKRQMDAIWLALQHAPDQKYTKKYFPFIEQAVENGDLPKEKYAVMLDRILMEEGKPQIYGSQIVNGKLYELEDPASVNERRKAMAMEPIENYLRTFNIKFEVE
jgi:hypothetical protein